MCWYLYPDLCASSQQATAGTHAWQHHGKVKKIAKKQHLAYIANIR